MSQKHKLEIMYDVLRIIKDNEKTSQIRQHNAFVNRRITHIVKQHIPELIAKNFVTVSSDNYRGDQYAVTTEGIAYLENYNTIMNFAISFGIV